MKFQYPDPDSLSDELIGLALANNSIEGFPFLDENGVPVPQESRIAVFREYIRKERSRQSAEMEAEENS